MRLRLALLLVFLGLAWQARAQSCTGLCLQQVSCPGGGTTTVTGTVYAPNGVDPLPNVTVYIPNAAVGPIPAGVQCPVPGALPSGSPLVGTTSATDGTFTLTNVPVGTNIPLVVITGKWRRQTTIDTSKASCANTAVDPATTRMPRNQSEGDIPKFAIATGSADQVECVLLKVGIDQAEFTDPSGNGRINLYQATGSGGARIDVNTPSAGTLTGTSSTLNNYDVVMLPCEGRAYTKPPTDLSNLVSFANAGGRVYSSHYGYEWMYENPPFDQVATWFGYSSSIVPENGTATVDQSFTGGATLAAWLQLTGASTTLGQIAVDTVRQDFGKVNPPTQSYLTLNNSFYHNPVMQFTFDTPVGLSSGQCGRVLFNEYHVENPSASPTNVTFPNECPTSPMTPQEKLLEYSLFDLTNDGGAPTMTPTSADFGTEAIGFQTASQTFTWKNNSVFNASVTSATASGDYIVTGNNCSSVSSGNTCSISVAFKPTTSGVRTGTLTVTSSANTLTASLTGTGVPTLTLSSLNLNFGKLDVGASATQTVQIINNAPGVVQFPSLVATGDYKLSTNCPAILAANAVCALSVTFTPSATGTRAGTMTASSADPQYAGVSSTFTGIGVDFSVALAPSSGSVIAGRGTTTVMTTTPIAGFGNNISLSCSTTAPGVSCAVSPSSYNGSAATPSTVTITSTSKYTVIGYGGYAGGAAALLALAFTSLLCGRRRRVPALARLSLAALALIAVGSLATGCSGKLPAENPGYTEPGDYSLTITATDGFLVHASTYKLTVTTK